MIKVGIDINEILRSRFIQFDRYYYNDFEDYVDPNEEVKYVYDLFSNYKWCDTVETVKYLKEDAPETISPIDYQLNDKGESNADSFLFEKVDESTSAIEAYNRFLYEDYNFEIHGAAPLIYKNLDVQLSKIMKDNKENIEFVAVSKENPLSIPPTLYFLGKNQLRFKKVFFVDDVNEMWNYCDVLITTDPNLLSNKPDDKKLIKVKRPYNIDIKSNHEFEITQIDELLDGKLLNEIIK